MVAVMLTGMAGCSSRAVNVKAADLMDGVKADSVTVDKKAFEFAGDVTDFAVRLVKECSENAGKAENMLISPLSVLLALSMTANGAQNETLAQMESVLGMSANELNEFAYRFMHDISAVSKNSGSLEPATAIWFKADPGFAVNKDFLQTNANYYDADLYSAPFDDSTLKDINKWVKNKTKGTKLSLARQAKHHDNDTHQ